MVVNYRSTTKAGLFAATALAVLVIVVWSAFSGHQAMAAPQAGREVPAAVPTQPTRLVTRTATPVSTATRGVPSPGATAVPTLCPVSFTDVDQGDWFFPYVANLFCRGAISGYSDNTFRPYNNTTRGQLSKIIVLAAAWPISTQSGPHFSDVPSTNPFYQYIETAYTHGVISGYADGTFHWGNNITRGQLSKIVVLARGWAANTSNGPHFSDVPADSPFYIYIETAYNKGCVSGYADGKFRSGADATRAQLSKIVQTALATR